ncbi:serine-type D-Ala-D-Ala carboxypeptidase domain protein [Haemophilus pittmaniae HK 85]|uniref:Serine-type D-Ala-D-Ala carboxypeptidase domain protein n=1 Tax=Haemophilus pittmaniae HK 85 TaxID=1035188 RepID=F9Q7X4_9PAST|nr:serine-type D-Ala-D-Ala carboxypeptidase domain protein [Haemophilus pittmaniae HK 85]
MSEFLAENLSDFDFALPFMHQPEGKKVGREPWHISYLPLAQQAMQLFTADVLLQAWYHELVEGKEILVMHLPEIFEQYMV